MSINGMTKVFIKVAFRKFDIVPAVYNSNCSGGNDIEE